MNSNLIGILLGSMVERGLTTLNNTTNGFNKSKSCLLKAGEVCIVRGSINLESPF